MARLHRPYIPLSIRVKVATRQLSEIGWEPTTATIALPAGQRLAVHLRALFGDKKFALDHDPALVNRRIRTARGKIVYIPDANDPNFLRYREAGPGSDHDIKTRVRGDGAQLSDLAKVRKRKRKERKAKTPKRKWPSRPLRSANRWENRK